MKFSAKKFFLFGFTLLLLVGIPASVFLLQQQQEIRSRAEKATILSFTPDSSASAPIQKSVGDSVPLDIMVDPGTNLVSFVKLEIQYDPDKLATATANTIVVNSSVFPSVLEGPVYSAGKIAVTLSVGPDPTKAVQAKSKAATITFTALENTDAGTPTLVTFSANTQALSIGPSDQASENVLASINPAVIAIAGGATTPTPTTTSSLTSTPTPTASATGTPTPTSSLTSTPTLTPTPTTTSGTGSVNSAPLCSSLAVDRDPNGTPPFSITFTANGTDSDGTISSVTFNFGDGTVEEVTAAGGIGTNTVNAQIAHTYNNTGTYQASAVLTDSNNATSGSLECTQTVTVSSGTGGGTTSTTTSDTTATATPTIAASGSTEILMGIGAVALFLMVAGGLIFFVL